MKQCMSKAVLPMVPESVFSAARETMHLPSFVTFMISPDMVYSPQTGHPWYLEMGHEMQRLKAYSLVPQKSENQYVSHYQVESRQPRFTGKFQFADAWLTTYCRSFCVGDFQFTLSQTFFHPERADDKLYFDRTPMHRMEIVVQDRLIEDRELWTVLEEVVPKEYGIRSLVQRLP